jgi:tetratricopeptide (TPR) repeat protein
MNFELNSPNAASAPTEAPAQARQPTGWRKWVFRFAAMTIVPALFLGLIEVTLRLAGYGYPTTRFFQRPDLTGPDYYIANADFGRRFFPPGLIRAPLPLKFPVVKPAGTQRIFILGESAALGFPDPSSSFPRILEVMLRDQFPEVRFAVINTSMVAINSNVILPIARECAGYQPDLFLVYMGNNEIVGPFGAAGVVGPFTPNLAMIRANLVVKTTRTGQFLHDAGQWLNPSRKPPQVWEGMAIFQHSHVRANDPQLEAIYDHLGQNLRDICRAGIAAGSRVIVSTVPVNLKDSAPFASLHSADLADDALQKWEHLYQEGIRLEADEKWSDAIARFEQADRIDGQFADLEFRWARCLLGLGKHAEARERFQQARDLDTLRFRSDRKTNATIRTIAEAEGVPLVDAEEIFAGSSPAGIPGEDFFLEHVHLNFRGNYLLARSFCEKILALPQDKKAPHAPILSEQECARRLAYTDWSRHSIAGQIQSMMRQPPFTSQLDQVERNRRWQKKVDTLRAQLQPDSLKKTAAEFEQATRDREADWELTLNFAAFLTEMGNLPRAISLIEKVVKQEPHIFSARCQLGQLELRRGRIAEARIHYETIIKFSPDYTEAHYGLAETLAADGFFESALKIYADRIKRDPTPAKSLEKMAGFLARQNKVDEAMTCLEQALAINPESASAHANLGDVLTELGRQTEARSHYETALRLRPGWQDMIDRLAKTAPK